MTQKKALAFLKAGYNVFLTGSAGTGKTYVLKQFLAWLKLCNIPTAVTASTGIAATHINGQTIHSWAGIGIKDTLDSSHITTLKKKAPFVRRIRKTKVLILDEISMLHKNQLNMVDAVLKAVNMTDKAFGGLQVVFCGDFFQLPPVSKKGETNREKYAFMANSWLEAKPTICYLDKQFRQEEQDELNQILENIRDGFNLESVYERLDAMVQYEEDEEVTKLFTHNLNVDQVNRNYLNQLYTKPKTYLGIGKGNPFLVEQLKKSVLTDEKLELKTNAKVMFIRNNPDKGVVNGSQGTIVNFTDEGPLVELLDGRQVIAEPEQWIIETEKGSILASYEQVPLRLAWAITVHKSQGMTLERAQVDLSRTFELGQGYVALSRVKSISGLQLFGINETAVQVDSLAAKADKRFKQLSELEDDQTNLPMLELAKTANLKRLGTSENAKEKKKIDKKPPQKKGDSIKKTVSLINEGKSLKDVADLRGLAETTVISHIQQAVNNGHAVNLSSLRVDSQIVKQVSNCFEELKKRKTGNEPIRLKAIHQELRNAVTYTQIKLALIIRSSRLKA